MKRYIVLLSLLAALCSCGGGNQNKSSNKSEAELTYPELSELVQESNEIWEIFYGSVSTVDEVQVNDKGGHNFDPVFLRFDHYGVHKERPEVYFAEIYIDYSHKRLEEFILKEGEVTVSNSINNETLVVKANTVTISDQEAIKLLYYIIKNPHGVTFSFQTPIDPITVYCENLEGFLPVYSYYMKMEHPDLPGTAFKAVQ